MNICNFEILILFRFICILFDVNSESEYHLTVNEHAIKLVTMSTVTVGEIRTVKCHMVIFRKVTKIEQAFKCICSINLCLMDVDHYAELQSYAFV